jgi:hypothetical protein
LRVEKTSTMTMKRARRSTKRMSPTSIAPMARQYPLARLRAERQGPPAARVERRITTAVVVAVAEDAVDRVVAAAAKFGSFPLIALVREMPELNARAFSLLQTPLLLHSTCN